MKFFALFQQDQNMWGTLGGSHDISESLSFGTQLNGGFAEASMEVPLPENAAASFARAVLGSECVIYDKLGRYIYNGRVTGVSTVNKGVAVTARGFWEDGSKITVPTALWLGADTVNGTVIQEAASLVPSWGPILLAANCNVPVGPQDYDEESKVNDIILEMLKVGYRTDDIHPAYIALYNNRVGEIIIEQREVFPDFYVTADTSKGSVGFSASLDNVYNKIYVLYDDPATDSVGPTMYPTPAQDGASQAKYGLREGVLNTGEYGLGIGLDLLEVARLKYSWPVESRPVTITGYVRNNAGSYVPSYMIRSGDFIVVTNNDVSGATAASAEQNKVLGFVMSTQYNAGSNTMNLTLASGDRNLEYLLARLGLSGGLG